MYHPETDGQTEVLNHILEQYLRSFVHDRPSLLYNFLTLTKWCYKTSTHSITGLSPFIDTYDKPPPSLPSSLLDSSPMEVMTSMVMSRQATHIQLQRRLRKAQKAMKHYSNKHRRHVSFDVGDLVYVCPLPYRQTYVCPHYTKISKRFYGPFPITDKVGPVAYHFELLTNSKIHPVFHISLLKAHKGPPPTQTATLPPIQTENHPVVEPLSFLDWKWDHLTTPPSRMVLVQWNGLTPEDASWEEWTTLHNVYDLEDYVEFPREGVVSNSNQGDYKPKWITRRPIHLEDYV